MKKFAIILAMSFLGTLAVNAINPINPVVKTSDAILYAKVINNTSTAFEYKVGNDVFTMAVGSSTGLAYEENTQILKKDSQGNWVNWFVFTSAYSGLTHQLSDLLNI